MGSGALVSFRVGQVCSRVPKETGNESVD
jgi:hypothetical protein